MIAFLCQVSFVNAAQITKTLVEDTKITPPGVMANYWRKIPTFKKDTTVILNEYGEVIEGTLESYAELPCVSGEPFYYRYAVINLEPNRIRTFKAGTKVTFNSKGEVIKGTIGDNLAYVPISQSSYIAVKKDTEVSFHGNGMIATCTLDYNTYLRPIGWQQNLTASYTNNLACPGFVEFKEKKIIELNDKGEVTKGTLNKDTKLPSPSGKISVYQAGTTVEFDDKGFVKKSTQN